MIQTQRAENFSRRKRTSVYLPKEKLINLKFNIENFEARECTYLLFGNEELSQHKYNCATCDPNRTEKMCKTCFEKCHMNCKKDSKHTPLLGIDTFVCECGKLRKHYIAQNNLNAILVKCKFRSIDKKIQNKYMYRCGEDDKVVCSICFHECHSACDPNKKTSTIIEDLDYECQCTNENHSALNEFTFSIKPEEYTQECGLPRLWPVQMLNILFSIDGSYEEMSNYISKNLTDLTSEARFANIVSLLSGIFNSSFKTYYYHPHIMDLFSYQKFITYLYKFKARNSEEFLIKMRMIFILLFIHVKKDFNLIKTFSISDFMTSSILERLIYKEFILSSNMYTKQIHKKYKINQEDYGDVNIEMENEDIKANDISLKRITTKVGSILAKAIKKCNLVSHQKEFSICLKLISFMLKRMVFTIKELNKLIKSIFNFNNEFILMVTQESQEELNPKIDQLIPIFSYLAKIFYLIGINYNDIIFNYTIEDTPKHKNQNFIHVFAECPAKLFTMIVKNCSVVTDYYKKIDQKKSNTSYEQNNKNQVLSDKVVRIFNEALKLFCLADNIYYDQIRILTGADIKVFDLRREQMVSHLLFKTLKKSDKESMIAEMSVLFELKQKIENTLDEFFTYKNITDTNERLIANIKEYSDKSLIIYTDDKSKKQQSQNSFTDGSVSSDDDDESVESIQDDTEKSIDFVNRLLSVIKEHFPFVKKPKFKQSIDAFVEEFIFSAIDETISKFLFFFCQMSTDQENILLDAEIEIVLNLLSFFCLNKAGIKYFCSGKNLIRVIKIFNHYPKRVLQFFFLIFEALKMYKVQIPNHKILAVMKKDFLDYLRNFNVNKSNILEFELQMVLMMRIFLIAADNYEFEFYESIKKEIIDIMRENKLFDKEKFKTILEIDYEMEKRIFEEQLDRRKTILLNEEVIIKENFTENSYEQIEDNILPQNDLPKSYVFSKMENSLKKVTNLHGQKSNEISIDSNTNLILNKEIKPMEGKMKLTNNQVNQRRRKMSNYNISINDRKILKKFVGKDTDESDILYKLYFSFFEFITKNTYYFFDTPQELQSLENILNLNDLTYIGIILSKNGMISIEGRKTLLTYLRTFYFIDIICKDDSNKKQGYLTNKEFITYYNKTLNAEPGAMKYQSAKEEREITKKYNFVKEIISVIGIFTHEIESFRNFLRIERNFQIIEDYLIELTLSVKFISNFILNEDIWNNVIIAYYKLAKTFLMQSEVIKYLLINVVKNKTSAVLPIIEKAEIELLKEMENPDFDIFDKKRIYDISLITLTDIFSTTNIDKKFRLETYLDQFDNNSELNFTPFSLIEVKDYEYFYEKKEEEKLIDKSEIRLKNTLLSYNKQFIDIGNSTFLNIIRSMSADNIDYRSQIVKYFLSYLNSNVKNHTDNYTYTMLCIITKMMFYDTDETQNKLSFLLNPSYDEFFQKFNKRLQDVFAMNYVTAKNINQNQRYLSITNINKLMIQFLQLLAEGFNTNYHVRIFSSIKDDLNFSLFENIVCNLVKSVNLMDFKYIANGELSYDKLIVLMTNIIDFMIEYAQQEYIVASEEKEDEEDVSQGKVLRYIKNLFNKKIHKILFLNSNKTDIDNTFPNRNKFMCYFKIKFVSLIIAFIQNRVNNIKFLLREYNPPILYEQIICNFKDVIDDFIKNKKMPKNFYELDEKDFLTIVTSLYIYDEDFRDCLKLTLCFKLYQLIKILSDIYGMKSIKSHLHEHLAKEEDNLKKEENTANPKNKIDLTCNSVLAYKIFIFLETVVVKVVIRDSEGKDCPSFFVRPSLTFHLTKQTMDSFINNVPRESTFSKLNSLIQESDYFVFEMACNSHYKKSGVFNKYFKNIKFVYFETVNYIFILVIQIILIIHSYKNVSLSDKEYEYINPEIKTKVYDDVFIVCLIQLSFISIILFIWYIYKFPLFLQHNLMSIFRRHFIFRSEAKGKESSSNKTIQKLFSGEDINIMKIVRELNSDINFSTKLKVGIFKTVMLNREVNTLFFTFIFTLVYLLIGNPIIVVIPCLFVYNLSPTLYNIIVVMRLRWKQLLTLLIFNYLIIYIFMWVALLWINKLFKFNDTKIPGKNDVLSESFCSSSIQCYLFILDWGIRSGGGIGDLLPMVSYKNSQNYFIGKFFFNVIFHIFVVMIMEKIFFGIIMNTFADLRYKHEQNEDDKKLRCYICQLSRDECMNKKIDFEGHCRDDHCVWNYVYFLTFLHITNPNDFNALQNSVWDKLCKKDISWIPIKSD